MRLLFVHDHRFLHGPDGAVHTVGSFPRSVWDRYLRHFSEIVVVARDGGALTGGSDLARSETPGVRFALVADYPLAQRLLGMGGEARAVLAREMAACDAVLVRVPSDLGNLAAAMARARGLPWAGEAVGCAWDGYGNHGNRLSRAYAPLAMHRMRQVASRAGQMLYVTREFLQRRYPGPADSVGVSDVEIEPLGQAQVAARDARLARLRECRPPVFGTVASLRVMSKGIQDAIPAIAQLKAQGLRVEYRVLGAGDRDPWIARAEAAGVADRVVFDGTRPSGDGVRGWLDEIDVHLQPSYQEGLPRATVEAMSRGCACAGSTAGGLPELLPSDRLHAPGDIPAIAKLIARFATEPAFTEAAARTDLATSRSYLPVALEGTRDGFYRRLAERAAA
ncbi:glycosyltransferase [Altererythrobacter aerius]|uniref:Glycosyltransferase n=1 Tax=Tsuneonella aeria TaxID=1837929 RepID=A0A6I4THF0_9SPHN|nr:glycosyltransferase family 4 protein [Tsuneonella aeria]MXO75495.1 glycosyltransferase [Tsuneonella aeria]